MYSKRFGLVAMTLTAAALLTACNGEDTGTGAASSSGAHSSQSTGHDTAAADGHGSGEWAKNQAGASFFGSLLDGASEVPVKGGPAVGDKDGHALALMRIQGDQVSYAFTFTGIQTPTLGHLHQGVKGVNGDVKIPFFTKKLADGSKFTYGTVTVEDADLLQRIKAHPSNWYFNLHTDERPGGAVRGQAYKLPSSTHVPDSISEDTLNSLVSSGQ
jgi:hypothetical protein